MVSLATPAFTLPHIKIRHLNKYYDVHGQAVHALKDIHLDIPQGKIFGIIGKSGAGKSSLLRTLNGLESISSGSIHVHEHDLASLNHAELIQLRQKIGMIFQHFNLMSAKTVWDNVALPLKIAGISAAEINTRVDEALQWVGLRDKAAHYPAQLSGGQKQRVGIARALVHHPDLLLCDEATSALDPESTATILSLLKDINQKLGITIVLITHEMQVIRDICDEVVVIDGGEIVESGQVWSVFARPQHRMTQELLNLSQLDLPFELHHHPQADDTHCILQLRYERHLHHPHDLNQIFNAFAQPVQLLQSHIDVIQQHVIGSMIVALPTQDLDLAPLTSQLQPLVADLKELGYARPTV